MNDEVEMYADDTTIYTVGKSLDIMPNNLNCVKFIDNISIFILQLFLLVIMILFVHCPFSFKFIV